MILSLVLKFRYTEVGRLIRHADAAEFYAEMAMAFFYPMTQEENINVLEDYVDKIRELQSRVSKSTIARMFVSYRDEIEKLENNIQERRGALKGDDQKDYLSFSTVKLSSVIAHCVFQSIRTSIPVESDTVIPI